MYYNITNRKKIVIAHQKLHANEAHFKFKLLKSKLKTKNLDITILFK